MDTETKSCFELYETLRSIEYPTFDKNSVADI